MEGFYEDPTLIEDELKMNEEMEERRRLEDALRPHTIDMNT